MANWQEFICQNWQELTRIDHNGQEWTRIDKKGQEWTMDMNGHEIIIFFRWFIKIGLSFQMELQLTQSSTCCSPLSLTEKQQKRFYRHGFHSKKDAYQFFCQYSILRTFLTILGSNITIMIVLIENISANYFANR